MKHFGTLVGLTLVVCLVLTGCGGGGSGSSTPSIPTLSSISVTSASGSSVAVGQTLPLVAKGTYSDSSTGTITTQVGWTSSDSSVATVSASGVVTGVNAGAATITAKMGSVSGTMSVTIVVGLSSIHVTAPATSLAAGATVQLTAQAVYTDNSSQLITSQATWHSSDATVATVSNSGLVSALKAGSVTISASQGSVTGTIGLTVTQATLSSINVLPTTFSIASGQTKQLAVQGFFTDGTSQDVTARAAWSSSSTGFATVSATGLVTGVAAGSSTITATVGSLTATSAANVTAAVLESITVTPASPSVPVGQSQQFTASGIFSDGSSTDMTNSVVWSSSAANYATVDQTGLATGVATGSATIHAASGSVTGSASLTVTSAVLQSIDITPDAQSIPVGGQLQLYVTGTYSDSTTQNLTSGVSWSSSNATLASVDPMQGVVTGVANSNGNAVTITATVGSLTNTTTVIVTQAVIESIAVSPATASIAAGTTQAFTVNATFSDGSVEQLTDGLLWVSSAPSIASVDATGVATGLSLGDATITATYGTFTGSAVLTVTPATLSSIVVVPPSPMVGLNGSIQFAAVGVFSDNSTQDLTGVATWSSSNAAVALVNNTGLATGLTTGSASITATYEGVSGSATLTVTTASLQSIDITPANPIVPPHTRIQMTAWGNYSDGSRIMLTSGVTWYTNTGRYMSVSGSGVVRTKRASTDPRPVYARVGNVIGQTSITITSMTLQSLSISPTNPTIAVGTTLPFQLIGTFSDGVTKVDLTRSAGWQTSNFHLAVINNSGIASGMAPGVVTITGSYGGLTPATTTLNVSNATIQSIAVTPATATVILGGMQQFAATGTFSDNSTQDITSISTWTSANPGIALVNSTGVATGVSSGDTNIKATFKGVTGSAVLTVN